MPLNIGVIGTDSSHVVSFSRMLNQEDHPFHVKGGKVTHAVRHCSLDFKLSYSREEMFSGILENELNIPFVAIDELTEHVDAIMIESADGREHLPLFKKVVAEGKPVFIDKPLAIGIEDAKAIIALAEEQNVPIMSSSSLRYSTVLLEKLAQIDRSKIKKVIVKCPLNIEPTQSRYYWYVVHGVEILYTVLGSGCSGVSTSVSESGDTIVGTWDNGVIGEVHCVSDTAQDFELTIVTSEGEHDISLHGEAHTVPYYASLVQQVVQFFKDGKPLIPYEEMLEVIWFMEQAEKDYDLVKA